MRKCPGDIKEHRSHGIVLHRRRKKSNPTRKMHLTDEAGR